MSEIDWLDDDDERGLESTAMTNRQWLMWQMIDMSDKELFNKYHGFMCDVCGNNNIFPSDAPCPHKCEQKIFDWLKQEYKND